MSLVPNLARFICRGKTSANYKLERTKDLNGQNNRLMALKLKSKKCCDYVVTLNCFFNPIIFLWILSAGPALTCISLTIISGSRFMRDSPSTSCSKILFSSDYRYIPNTYMFSEGAGIIASWNGVYKFADIFNSPLHWITVYFLWQH